MYDLFTGSPEGGAIMGASGWVTNLLTGQIATMIAILAVALLGYEILLGRISMKATFRVVLGSFILFGAPAIVRGLLDAGQGVLEVAPPVASVYTPPPPTPLPMAPRKPGSNPFDPYSRN